MPSETLLDNNEDETADPKTDNSKHVHIDEDGTVEPETVSGENVDAEENLFEDHVVEDSGEVVPELDTTPSQELLLKETEKSAEEDIFDKDGEEQEEDDDKVPDITEEDTTEKQEEDVVGEVPAAVVSWGDLEKDKDTKGKKPESDFDILLKPEEEQKEEEEEEEKSSESDEVSLSSLMVRDVRPEEPLDIDLFSAPSISFGTAADVDSIRPSREQSIRMSLASEIKFDPSIYYSTYDNLYKNCLEAKIKNNRLQRLLKEYFIQNKQFHLLAQEGKRSGDHQKKYERYLDNLGNVIKEAEYKEGAATDELNQLRQKRDDLKREAEGLFEKLRNEQVEVGKEICSHGEAEKDSREKIIEICLKRQKNQLAHIIEMRFRYLKLLKKQAEAEKALSELDNLGPNLRLMDYEQLKITNRSLRDKLEDKEEELMRIRKRCQNGAQTMAHVREKVASLDDEIQNLTTQLYSVQEEYYSSREELTEIKKEKDWLRRSVTIMKNKSGLLLRPKLLQDLAKTLEEGESMKKAIGAHKLQFEKIDKKVEKIKQVLGSPAKLEQLILFGRLLEESSESSTTDIVSLKGE